MNSYIAREVEITANGKTYKLSRLDEYIINKFVAWARSKLPNPIETVAQLLPSLCLELQREFANRAYEDSRKPLAFDSKEVSSLLNTLEGGLKIIALLLQKYQPNLTDAETFDFFKSCVQEHGESFIAHKIGEAAGQTPEQVEEIQKKYLQDKGLLPTETLTDEEIKKKN